MGVIRIFANGVELDFVKETLTIKKENNAFIQDFKVSHSSFPFLIIENLATKQALGTRDITSVQKRKVVPVVVLEMGERYYGELTIQSYLRGYRKCDVKYGSEVLTILDKKLSEVLPSVSVIPGVTVPVPFSEELLDIIPGHQYWSSYPLSFLGKIYPEVNFGFPQMLWKDKYGEDPEENDEWFYYADKVNRFRLAGESIFITNNYAIATDVAVSVNQNVAMPQLFVLGAIRLAFASIGYSIGGTFTESDFARRLMLLSLKDNLCKVAIAPAPVDIHFNQFINRGFFFYHYYIYSFVLTAAGDYTFDYNVAETVRPGTIATEPTSALTYGTGDNQGATNSDVAYRYYNDPQAISYSGTFTITVSEEEIGNTFNITYMSKTDAPATMPNSFFIVRKHDAVTFNMMHPTISLGRYAPDWSVSGLINEVKKWFGLDIRFNDNEKKVYFNYAQDLLLSGQIFDSGKSLAVAEYNPPPYTGFLLKYANDQDGTLYVDTSGINPDFRDYKDNENIEIIESKFKNVDVLNGTASLTYAADKEGTGLMVYDPGSATVVPFILREYNGRHLGISGSNGVYANSFKTLLHFRLYGSQLEIEGPFTEHQLQRMDQYQKIAIDNQAYVILSAEFKPTAQGNYLVTLELQSITF